MTGIPNSVRRGVYALALATIATAVYVWSDPEMWRIDGDMALWMWGFFLTTNALFVCLLLLTWRRRNWARWATVVWCVVGWLALIASYFYLDTMKTFEGAIELALIAVEVWGCQQLVTRSASLWFRTPVEA